MDERSSRVENTFNALGKRVVTALGRQEWLERPSYRLEHALSFAYLALGDARERVVNLLNGVWLGHPLHPPLTDFAIGSVGATVALDAISLLPGRPASGEAARLARHGLGAGILANLAAAATGVTDWQHTHEEARRVGLVHGALNTAATAMYAVSWWDRHRGRRRRGIASTAAGYGLTLASGYLGGKLVFEWRIGTDHSGPRLASREWSAALPSASLQDGQLNRVEVDGVGLVVHRDGQRVTAFGQYCPHLAAPMADGWVDRGRVVCPWHGSRFELESGEVQRGPATSSLPCYQARVRDGMIEVRDATHQHVAGGKARCRRKGVTP